MVPSGCGFDLGERLAHASKPSLFRPAFLQAHCEQATVQYTGTECDEGGDNIGTRNAVQCVHIDAADVTRLTRQPLILPAHAP